MSTNGSGKTGGFSRVERQADAPQDTSQTVLELRNLTRVFGGEERAVDDVTLSVKRGEIVVIVGERGFSGSFLIVQPVLHHRGLGRFEFLQHSAGHR
jgi:ATPase subunit of ABC transporter with duplicated ATPase domains